MRCTGRDVSGVVVGRDGSGDKGITGFSSAMSINCWAHGGRFSEQKCASSKTACRADLSSPEVASSNQIVLSVAVKPRKVPVVTWFLSNFYCRTLGSFTVT
mmetsp:Transcript_19310/g.23000  ORF Transcript_19310/g.23000 Transcript_19310/m.23000 type:complete len:101 (-) Transcript_19310:419-721(-)